MPVRIFVTAGTTADCKLGEDLIKGFDALALLADRGYDVNSIIELARSVGMEIVIPPKKNRIEQRDYDKDLYKLRTPWKTPFSNSSNGAESPLVTRKTPLLSSLLFKSAAFLCG